MGFWNQVLSRISVPGLLLMTAGALLCLQTEKLCRLLWKDNGEKAMLPVKIVGLVLVALGTLVILDIIPGL